MSLRLKGWNIKSFAVILAGGQGERLWPISQPDFPKQFISIFNNKPLLIQTIERIEKYFNRKHRLLVLPEQLIHITKKFVGNERILTEPARKNTAPAICLAAMVLKKEFGDGLIHIMPADHIIKDRREFIKCLKLGGVMAQKGYLVAYGIVPQRPETGYGYIKVGKIICASNRIKAFNGAGFTEKPSKKRAMFYIKEKEYLWNSGIFTYQISTILNEIKNYVPQVYYGVETYLKQKDKKYFESIPEISIDYGVMEKSNRICVIKSDFGWDDVGTWLALERYFKKDKRHNIFIGDAQGLDIKASIVYSYNIPVRVYGATGIVVIASSKGVLVCKKNRAPDLKDFCEKFKKEV